MALNSAAEIPSMKFVNDCWWSGESLSEILFSRALMTPTFLAADEPHSRIKSAPTSVELRALKHWAGA